MREDDRTSSGEPYRKRLRRRECVAVPRFITFSCYKRWPLLHHPEIMNLFAASLARARSEQGLVLYAWVAMPEHVHLLVRPAPGGSWADIASSLKTSVAKRVISRWRELQAPILNQLAQRDGTCRFWQHGGGFDRTVRNEAEFTKFVCYIHRNPVERRLVAEAEAWRWSSVRWWMGQRLGEVECDPPPGDPRSWAQWMGYV